MGSVVVEGPRVAEPDHCLTRCQIDVAPAIECGPPDWEWPAVAMEGFVAEIEISLDPIEPGQHGIPVPTKAAGRRPAVEVAWLGPYRQHSVHCRASAHTPAT